MKKFLIIALMSLSLQSCSTFDPMGILKPDKPSIEVNANVGKNVEQEKSNIKLESGSKTVKQDAEKITNDTNTDIKADIVNQITNNITPEQILWFGLVCFIVGVLCPDVPRLYGAAKYVIKDIFQGIIVNPIKGCIEFFRK